MGYFVHDRGEVQRNFHTQHNGIPRLMIRTSIFLVALATAGAAALVLSARAGAAAMRWAIGRAILSYW